MGVEALIRWRRDDKMIPPGAFLPDGRGERPDRAAGDVGDRRGVPAVEGVRRRRPSADPGGGQRISAQQFQAPGFTESVERILRESEMPPYMMELEITEEATFGDPERVAEKMRTLKSIGVDLAIDDFGTGYSSLAYLTTFPVDVLKIDQKFVREMETSTRDASIVNMIVSLARRLEFKVVAEGVETQPQQEYLRAIGCDVLQGFYYSRPLPADSYEAYLRKHDGDPADQVSA